MNLTNLLIKEKRVAGIEISDSVIRIAFFRPKTGKKKPASKELSKGEFLDDDLILIEEPIAADIISEGVVLDVDLLGKTLRNIWVKANLGTNYAIIAIPDDKIYSRIFSFPKSVTETRLTEAMRLAISFQLPTNTADLYLDWESLKGTSSANEIFLSTIPRKVAEGYVLALEKAGIKTLALESHLSAIARAVKSNPDETIIFSKKTPDGETIFALNNGTLRFSRTLPLRFVPESKIPEELSKVKESLIADTKGQVTEKKLIDAELQDEYASRPEITSPKSKWIIALGAAIRGRIPEGKDNLVSLLPIGTEEAYAYQKATTFIVLMRNLIVGVSLFFMSAHLATYLFMLSLSENTNEKIVTLSAVSIPPELTAKQQLITEINTITETGSIILAQTPIWSSVLEEISTKTPEGVTLSTLSAPSFTELITLAGIARDRAVLNSYKISLQESALFSEVDIPLTNLDQKEMIPFTASFRIKDPTTHYYSNQTQ